MARRLPHLLASLAAAAIAVPAATAVAQAPAAPAAGTIVAVGTGSVTPTPADRTSNASIAKAVAVANAAALPLAIKAARTRAGVLARESGLTLGTLVGIADQNGSPFFYSPYGLDGTFGPGKFCGTVPRFRTTRLANGRVMRKRIGSRRQCRIPPRVSTTVSVTYATVAAPAA